MFKNKCPKCHKKVDKKYEYCPFCGFNLGKRDDYGLLGRNDFDEFSPEVGNPFIEKIFESAFKILEKQMKSLPKETIPTKNFNNLDVQFYVNGKKVDFNSEPKSKKQKNLSKEQETKFSKFPKKEPKSNIKRFSGKLIYELKVPGVENINDVLINHLETSTEIKALGKDKIYSKIINLKLPILNYRLEKGNLILEFKDK